MFELMCVLAAAVAARRQAEADSPFSLFSGGTAPWPTIPGVWRDLILSDDLGTIARKDGRMPT